MEQITQEKIISILDSAPESIRDAFWSEENIVTIHAVSERNHLDAERTGIVGMLAGRILLGLLHPEDLAHEIANEAKVDKRIADSVAKEIIVKVLGPIAKDLNKTYGFHIRAPQATHLPPQAHPTQPPAPTPTPPATEPPQPQPAAPQQSTPTPQPETPAAPAAPVILHQHEEVEKASDYSGGLVRPTFYTPPGEAQEEAIDSAPQARLEIGADLPQPTIEPKTARVGKEKAKIIHYTAPEVPGDPFAGGTPAPGKPADEPKEKSPSEVPPGNVVDLKDLPQ